MKDHCNRYKRTAATEISQLCRHQPGETKLSKTNNNGGDWKAFHKYFRAIARMKNGIAELYMRSILCI